MGAGGVRAVADAVSPHHHFFLQLLYLESKPMRLKLRGDQVFVVILDDCHRLRNPAALEPTLKRAERAEQAHVTPALIRHLDAVYGHRAHDAIHDVAGFLGMVWDVYTFLRTNGNHDDEQKVKDTWKAIRSAYAHSHPARARPGAGPAADSAW